MNIALYGTRCIGFTIAASRAWNGNREAVVLCGCSSRVHPTLASLCRLKPASLCGLRPASLCGLRPACLCAPISTLSYQVIYAVKNLRVTWATYVQHKHVAQLWNIDVYTVATLQGLKFNLIKRSENWNLRVCDKRYWWHFPAASLLPFIPRFLTTVLLAGVQLLTFISSSLRARCVLWPVFVLIRLLPLLIIDVRWLGSLSCTSYVISQFTVRLVSCPLLLLELTRSGGCRGSSLWVGCPEMKNIPTCEMFPACLCLCVEWSARCCVRVWYVGWLQRSCLPLVAYLSCFIPVFYGVCARVVAPAICKTIVFSHWLIITQIMNNDAFHALDYI